MKFARFVHSSSVLISACVPSNPGKLWGRATSTAKYFMWVHSMDNSHSSNMTKLGNSLLLCGNVPQPGGYYIGSIVLL